MAHPLRRGESDRTRNPAIGGLLKLLAHEEDAVGVCRVVQILAFNLRVGIGYRYALRVYGIEVIVLAEAKCPQQHLAAFQGFGFGQPRLTGGLIVEVERLARQQDHILELGPAILHQIAPQRRKPDAGNGRDAEYRKTDHNQQLVGYSQIAKHWAPYC